MTSKGARLYPPRRNRNGGPKAAVSEELLPGCQRTDRRLDDCVTRTSTVRCETLPL